MTSSWFFILQLYRLLGLCHYAQMLKDIFNIQPTLCLLHIVPLLVLCHYVHLCILQSATVCLPDTLPSLVLCQYAHYYLQHTAHSRCASHWNSVCFVSLCPVLSSTVCPLSVITSHCTVCWFCVAMSTVVFYSLSTVCQYLALYRLLFLCHYQQCCILQSVRCLYTSHNTSFWRVTMSTCVFCNLPTVCFLTMYRLFILCHYAECWTRQSVHCLSESDNVRFLGSVSLRPFLSPTVCPISVYVTPYHLWFSVAISTATFHVMFTNCLPHTLLSLVLFHYATCDLLHFVRCPSTSHGTSVVSVSQCPLLASTFCPFSVYLTTYCIQFPCHYVHCCYRKSVHWLSNPNCNVFGSMSLLSSMLCPISVYFSLYRLLALCHYVHCCLQESVLSLSVFVTLPSVYSVSLCPLLCSTVYPLSVSTYHTTVCFFCVTMSTAVFYSLSTFCQ